VQNELGVAKAFYFCFFGAFGSLFPLMAVFFKVILLFSSPLSSFLLTSYFLPLSSLLLPVCAYSFLHPPSSLLPLPYSYSLLLTPYSFLITPYRYSLSVLLIP